MGWGVSWNEEMYISRERFETEYELDSKIEETKEFIEIARTKILMAMMGGKNSFELEDCEGNKCDAVDVVYLHGKEILDWLIELNDRLFMYESLKKHFKDRENT